MLYNVYHAKKCHATVAAIDGALQDASIETLMKMLNTTEYEELINDVNVPLCEDEGKCLCDTFTEIGLPHVETHLEVVHASIIEKYNEKLKEDPEYVYCSCECLCLKSN